MWQDLWKQYVDSLSDTERWKLFRHMRLSADGFRPGARKIPPQRVYTQLLAVPATRGAEFFIDWFRATFGQRWDRFQNGSAEELRPRLYEFLQDHPPLILKLALALVRPDLVDLWDDQIEFLAQRDEAFSKRIDELAAELREAKQQALQLERQRQTALKALEKQEAELERAERSAAEWKQRAEEARQAAEQRRAALEAELEELRRIHREQAAAAQELETRLQELERAREQDAATIGILQEQVEAYRRRRLETESLYQLYRGLSGFVAPETPVPFATAGEPFAYAVADGNQEPGDAHLRLLVVGDAFPPQMFRFRGELVRIEAVHPPEELEGPFLQRCAGYDRVVLLSSCHHRVRLRLYQALGGNLLEVSSLSQLTPELLFGAEVHDRQPMSGGLGP